MLEWSDLISTFFFQNFSLRNFSFHRICDFFLSTLLLWALLRNPIGGTSFWRIVFSFCKGTIKKFIFFHLARVSWTLIELYWIVIFQTIISLSNHNLGVNFDKTSYVSSPFCFKKWYVRILLKGDVRVLGSRGPKPWTSLIYTFPSADL